MKRACIYNRVSTDEQGYNFSLETQDAANRAYAEAASLFVPDEFHFFEDYTGTTPNRPELNKLREMARRGEFEALIVYDTDRLTRGGMLQGLLLRSEFAACGVEIHVTTRGEIINRGDETANLINVIRDYQAGEEVARTRERTMRGRRRKAEAGYVVGAGRPLYGYRLVRAGDRGHTYEIEPESASVVRRIFDLYESGVPVVEIARRLSAERAPSSHDMDPRGEEKRRRATDEYEAKIAEWERRGKPGRKPRRPSFTKHIGYGAWEKTRIYTILRQKAYAGTLALYKQQVVTTTELTERGVTRKQKRINRPPEEWVEVAIPPIVPLEQWERVQVKLDAGRRDSPRGSKHQYLMARRLTCNHCDSSIRCVPSSIRGRTYLYYACSGKIRTHYTCDLTSFRAELVDEVVWNWVCGVIRNPRLLVQGRQRVEGAHDRHMREIEARLREVEARLERLDSEMGRLERAYAEGVLALKRFRLQYAPLEQEVSTLERERETLRRSLAESEVAAPDLDLLAALAEMLVHLDHADFEARRWIVERVGVTGRLADEGDEKVLYLIFPGGTDRIALRSESAPSGRAKQSANPNNRQSRHAGRVLDITNVNATLRPPDEGLLTLDFRTAVLYHGGIAPRSARRRPPSRPPSGPRSRGTLRWGHSGPGQKYP